MSRHRLSFSFVSELLARQARELATNRFLERDGDLLVLRVESMSLALRQHISKLVQEFGEVQPLRDFVGGMFFEEKTIKNRLANDPKFKPRYTIYDGFDRHQVIDNFENEVDIDFIIYDTQLNHYYFSQAKHALLGELADFSTAIERLQKDIGHGLHQLREAKRLLESDNLTKTLAHLGIEGASAKNSSFVLLHNIETFDYQTTGDGIVLYEWASFRNLLLDCEVTAGHSSAMPRPYKLQQPVLLNDPDELIATLFREHPVYANQESNVWAVERATTSFLLKDIRIEFKGLGI